MTQHVRAGYRRHRKFTWAVVLGVLIAGALALVIPALGASGDLIPPASTTQSVTPTDVPVGGSNFDCTTNTGGVPANLRSFSVSTPPNSTTPVVYNSANTASSSTPLPAGVTFTLTGYNGQDKGKYFDFSTAGSSGINVSVFHVGVKGGNDVAWYNYYTGHPAGVANDTRLHATLKDATNLYNASITTFCYALTTTISGKLYLDRNDFTSSSGQNGFTDVPVTGWTVRLFQKVGSSYTAFNSTTSGSDGTYTFTGVPIGSDYKVCVSASSTDDSSAWGLMSPTGNTACGPLSSQSDSTSAGVLISNLTAAAASPATDFALAPVVRSFAGGGTATTSDQNYSVIAGSSSTKDPRSYVQQTWTSGGHVFFEFAPLSPCTSCGQIYLLETLKGQIADSVLNGQQLRLKYDDIPPYGDNLVEMPYCQADPRPANWPTDTNLATTGILPSGATSCIVTGSQVVGTGSVSFNYQVYTAYDGGRSY